MKKWRLSDVKIVYGYRAEPGFEHKHPDSRTVSASLHCIEGIGGNADIDLLLHKIQIVLTCVVQKCALCCIICIQVGTERADPPRRQNRERRSCIM